MSECRYRLIQGDCVAVLPTLPAASFDAVICDPPYPCIKRSYGTWTEAEWFALMRAVVPECMRVLKPSGSAVFVLQPNFERVGRMRTWLWEFLCWVGKEWGIVQDAYWWNYTSLTLCAASQKGLMRSSVKTCIWVGPSDCYRDQSKVYWAVAQDTLARKSLERFARRYPSGHVVTQANSIGVPVRRGGSTPYNLLPVRGISASESTGHGAGTPLQLCDWWTRYLVPPGGSVLDPFAGTATTGIAALNHGATYVGIEKELTYCEIARTRLDKAEAEQREQLFA